MGRPIKARYFVQGGAKTASDVVKYKGITSLVRSNGGTGYSTGAYATVSAPQDAAGVQATVSLTITPAGAVTAAAIGNVGSGYSSAPTVQVVPAANQSNTAVATTSSFTLTNVSGVQGLYPGMLVSSGIALGAFTHIASVGTNTITLDKAVVSGSTGTSVAFTYQDTGTNATITVSLTQAEDDTGNIACVAYISTASSAVSSAIIKQEGSHRYLVENAQGRGICKLTTGTVTAGLMSITATDANGNTYSVSKLTARKATVTRKTQNGSNAWVYGVLDPNTGSYLDVARWTTGSAVGTDKTQSTTKISIGVY